MTNAVHQVTAGTHCCFAFPPHTFFLVAAIENTTFGTPANVCSVDPLTSRSSSLIRGRASMCKQTHLVPVLHRLHLLPLLLEAPPTLLRLTPENVLFEGAAPTPWAEKSALVCGLESKHSASPDVKYRKKAEVGGAKRREPSVFGFTLEPSRQGF